MFLRVVEFVEFGRAFGKFLFCPSGCCVLLVRAWAAGQVTVVRLMTCRVGQFRAGLGAGRLGLLVVIVCLTLSAIHCPYSSALTYHLLTLSIVFQPLLLSVYLYPSSSDLIHFCLITSSIISYCQILSVHSHLLLTIYPCPPSSTIFYLLIFSAVAPQPPPPPHHCLPLSFYHSRGFSRNFVVV